MNTDFFTEYCVLAADGTEISENSEQTSESAEATSDVTPAETTLLGVGTVFVGLIAIILICSITGFFCNLGAKKADEDSAEPVASVPQAPQANAEIEMNRGELACVIAAAIAEETGTDIAGIKILSIKRV